MADTGLILKGVGGFYTVLCGNGEELVCRARGRFRKEGITPSVGDRVEYVQYGEGRSIISILPRRNEFIRPAVANLDKLMIVASLSAPKADLLLVDKLIIRCEKHNVEPIIILNKCDEADEEALCDIRAQYQPTGYTIIVASAACGVGIDRIKAEIAGNICCFAGQSAVGKSSLINAVVPELCLETGGLSRKTDRGRHTTRHAQLWQVCGGAVLDTPGFSLLEADEMEPEELCEYYREMRGKRTGCRFGECLHRSEPDCAVKPLIGSELSVQRYERYLTLLDELIEKRKHKYD